MKIRIKKGAYHLRIYLPTRLLFNKTTARLANTFGRAYALDTMKNIPPQALESLCAELSRMKKQYGEWELVNVESASGEIVEVIL